MNAQIPNDWRRTYLCPVTDCRRHEHGFPDLKSKKQHIVAEHSDTRKEKADA